MFNPMEQGMPMPVSHGHRKFGMLGVALTTVAVVVVVVHQSNAVMKRENSALADVTTQLVANGCSAAERSILDPLVQAGGGFVDVFTRAAKYGAWSGWDADGTAASLSQSIGISLTCAHCFADAAGTMYNNCKSGDCGNDQCGRGCADCLAPAKHQADSCVGGEIVQAVYSTAMRENSCREGISGVVSADHCASQTGLSCGSSADCPLWSLSRCVGGMCQCSPPYTCSVNDGECVAPGNCPKFTGGTCAYFGCNAHRNAECIGSWGSGKCMCSAGQCVHDGFCV